MQSTFNIYKYHFMGVTKELKIKCDAHISYIRCTSP